MKSVRFSSMRTFLKWGKELWHEHVAVCTLCYSLVPETKEREHRKWHEDLEG